MRLRSRCWVCHSISCTQVGRFPNEVLLTEGELRRRESVAYDDKIRGYQERIRVIEEGGELFQDAIKSLSSLLGKITNGIFS